MLIIVTIFLCLKYFGDRKKATIKNNIIKNDVNSKETLSKKISSPNTQEKLYSKKKINLNTKDKYIKAWRTNPYTDYMRKLGNQAKKRRKLRKSKNVSKTKNKMLLNNIENFKKNARPVAIPNRLEYIKKNRNLYKRKYAD